MRQHAACSVLPDGPEDAPVAKKSHRSDLAIDLTKKKVKAVSKGGIDNGDELVWTFQMKKNGVKIPNEGVVDINLVYKRPLSTDPPPSASGGNLIKVDIVEPLTAFPADVTYEVTHDGTLLTWDGPQPTLVIDHIGDPPGDGNGGGGPCDPPYIPDRQHRRSG